jgi:hypothetical protein
VKVRGYNQKAEHLEVQDVRLLVKKQAIRHTRRLAHNPLFEQQRPNEPEVIKQYRNGIKRMLSKDGIDRWISKISRIIEMAGLNIERTSINENTADFLSSEPLAYMWQYSSIQEYFLRLILPYCIEDPNAILVAFPYNAENRETPLSRPISEGGLPPNTNVSIRLDIIPVEDIIYVGELDFTYYGWETEINFGNNGEKRIERVKIAFTENDIFILWPRYDEKLMLVYDTELWYNHNLGFLSINYLPGRLCIAEDGNYYNESYLHPYFEYADEFLSSFTDVQANRVSHLYPKVIMTEMPCPAKGCNSGRIKVTNKEGETEITECHTCSGTGIIKDPGPYGVILQKPKTGIDAQGGSAPPPYQYISPPTDTFNIAWEKTFELLERAKKSIGLDLLLNLNESGVAMEHRLEDLEDLLRDFAGALIDTMEVALETIDAYLNYDPSRRKAPKIVRPKRYDIKTALGHKMDYDNALPFDRYNTAVSLIQNKYRGDDIKQHIYKLAFKYAPELLLSEQEFNTRVASGIYNSQNVAKRDNVVMFLSEIAESMDENRFLDMTFEQVKPMLDAALAEIVTELPIPFRDDNGEII